MKRDFLLVGSFSVILVIFILGGGLSGQRNLAPTAPAVAVEFDIVDPLNVEHVSSYQDSFEKAVLYAILTIESNHDPFAVGRAGERGLYQFMESTWLDRTTESFDLAFDPEVSTRVATDHLRWIIKYIETHTDQQATPQQIFAAWNAGVGWLRRNNWDYTRSRQVRSYVDMAMNYYDF